MLLTARNLLFFPREVISYLINWLILKYSNSSYKKFPKIKGVIVRRGSGFLNLGKNISINSNMIVNPVGLSSSCMFYIAPEASISIGDNVGISSSLFYSHSKITIENNVLIGGGSQLIDTDFHSIEYTDRIKNDNTVLTKPIVIREGAFIGGSCIVLKGVTIGKRSVVGAGSVVSKNIPDDEVWGGAPARFIKKINNRVDTNYESINI